jgi:predicted glycoside hydrolase/deacetylase ChbG (UPF0249 family)
VIADDFGIGPATTYGILEAAEQGVLSGAVLLANSPHAEAAVQAWRRRGMPVRLGWHPTLTLDRPVLPAGHVPSLVQPDGQFHTLGAFLARLYLGQITAQEVAAELAAQLARYLDLTGRPPAFVNGHQHLHIFPVVGAALRQLLTRQQPKPFLRRVGESFAIWCGVPGARFKRLCLSLLGRAAARRQVAAGFPGADCLLGVTDPRWVEDVRFFRRWLRHARGELVELMVHPGFRDETLIGRDCTATDGRLQRRESELRLLLQPEFRDACRQAGLQLIGSGPGAHRGERGAIDVA